MSTLVSELGRRPVFLHDGWRSGSTFMWNAFRCLDEVRAFKEPFHEHLRDATPESVAAGTWDSWPSGHPPLDAPYFEEYLPLLGSDGVKGYRREFAYHQFLAPGLMHDERPYLQGLLDLASEQGRTGVLSFCRSLGRVGWFKAAFPDALHVYQRRGPSAQYASCRRQADELGNFYFLCAYYTVLLTAPASGPLGAVRVLLGVQDLSGEPLARAWAAAVALVAQRRFERDEEVFLHLYGFLDWHANAFADLVLDVDELAGDVGRMQSSVETIEGLTGLRLNLDDLSVPSAPSVGWISEDLPERVARWIDGLPVTSGPAKTNGSSLARGR